MSGGLDLYLSVHFRHKNGPKIPEEKNYKAEEFSSRVHHLTLPVTLSFHHQHVWDIL